MIKAAIYARYSSDNQSDASIEDQVRLCKERAEREGWTIVECYSDHGISGASLLLRPQVQKLVQDALSGRFQIVLTESLDRLSRDLADVAGVYKRLSFADVKIVTLSEGEISELHVGLKGTMAELYLKDLRDKTRRGLRGRVEKGKSGGGNSYGYDVVRKFDADGEAIRGDRTINEDQAAIVRGILEDYANGKAPRSIAISLNREVIPGPTGKAWGPSTINGNRRRGTGILNNELYVGRLVWNRLRYLKNPDTGKRISRLNPEDEWIIKDVPDLRIIDDDLWGRVKMRQKELDTAGANPVVKKRARYVFSGLIKCGCCGSSYVMGNAYKLVCAAARDKGTCTNHMTIKRADLEQRILQGMTDNLMQPELFEEFCAEYTRHINKSRIHLRTEVERKKNQLVKVQRELLKLIQAIKDGLPPLTLKEQFVELEDRKALLRQEIENAVEPPVLLHPNMANLYKRKLSELSATLGEPATHHEAISSIRSLVEKITVTPGENGVIYVDLVGDLASMLSFAAAKNIKPTAENARNGPFENVETKMVAGVGFEPTTFRL